MDVRTIDLIIGAVGSLPFLAIAGYVLWLEYRRRQVKAGAKASTMKYSLRSLMIVVTLVCMALGARIEYLRRWGRFHDGEVDRYLAKIEDEYGKFLTAHGVFGDFKALQSKEEKVFFLGNLRLKPGNDPDEESRVNEDFGRLIENYFTAIAYKKSMLSPWRAVDLHLPSDAQPPANDFP